MKDIKLYINNKQVDLAESSLPITYTQEDLTNPTIVKNSFSKTITLPGSKTNNSIFGEFYRLDRLTLNHSGNTTIGVEFDPSKRVDFKLFFNGEIIESGYCQLNAVNIVDNVISYDITLYGGLGDFFYKLSYKEDGSKVTLADLDYDVNFKINKDYINDCFDNPYRPVTFIPSLNGVYDNFDNNSCLINVNDLFPKEIVKDNVKYTPFNGFALGKLNRSYNEWEIRDLRSYKQRPALRVKDLFLNILKYSGYEYELDSEFFNDKNPYWAESFIALSLLDNESEETEEAAQLDKLSGNWTVGNIQTATGILEVEGNENIQQVGEFIDLSKINTSSNIQVNLDCNLIFRSDELVSEDTLYSSLYRSFYNPESDYTTTYKQISESLLVKLIAEDESGNIVAESPEYNFQDKEFRRISGNQYALYDSGNTFRFTLTTSKNADKIKLKLITTWNKLQAGSISGVNYLFNKQTVDETDSTPSVTGNITVSWDVEDYSLEIKETSNIASNSLITKDILLKTDNTPADYLLSFSKLFGLYYIKDIVDNKITILSRKSFYKQEIINLENRIDYSKDFAINPILFDKKWYKLTLETPETYFSKKYNKVYSQDYGQQRLDTGYNFNNETEDLYSDNVFKNIVTCRDSDKFYRTFYNKANKEVPCFLNDNLTYQLFNNNETGEEDLYGVDFIDKSKTTEWNNLRGTDCFLKTCFYSLDNDEKSLEDISNSLVFFNGLQGLKDSKNNEINYYISDDLPEMIDLNDEPCWLYTSSEFDESGEQIAIKRNTLPQFTRYIINNNTITHSFDFGVPKEIYINNINYLEDSTIYAKYWKSFYNDQFNVNTKKITCYVNLLGFNVKQDLLRKFYYFQNSIWVLNKIDSFDVTSDNTTRCEFIKVQDINNYGNWS